MLNLLTAELHRVRRDPVCWLLLAASSLCGLFFCFECVGPEYYHFDDIFILPFYVVPAIFISLSIGREYSDGTLRNKIIVGKSRSFIFLSKVIFGIGVSLSLTAAFLIPCICMMYTPVLSAISAPVLVRLGLGFTLLNITWAVLFTVVSMLVSAKGVGGILNLVLVFAIVIGSESLHHALINEPEYLPPDEDAYTLPLTSEEIAQIENDPYGFEGFVMSFEDVDGTVTLRKADPSKLKLNPDYIQPPLRNIVGTVYTALPFTRCKDYIRCLEVSPDPDDLQRIECFPLYDALSILVFVCFGFVLFRKKEIR